MQKILKTVSDVPLKAHQFLALPLSVIMGKSGYENWLYNEFTQLLAHHNDKRELSVMYYNYTFMEEYEPLDCLRLTDKMLEVGEQIVDFFKIMLSHNYYVYEFCDDFYISALHVKHHRYHDLLIYGYSDEESVFYGKAYVGTEIQDIVIPCPELIQAHNSAYIPSSATKSIFFYKLRDDQVALNPEKLKWHLLDYLEGVDSLSRERPRAERYKDVYWGIRVYDTIERAILEAPYTLTRNNMYCVYEHKCHMRNKLIYFSEHSQLVLSKRTEQKLNEVCDMAEAFFKITMKVNYKLSANLPIQRERATLIAQLRELKSTEMQALQTYYDENRSVFEAM